MSVGLPLDAVTVVTEEVRELVRRSGVDPARDPEQVRRLVDEVVADYDERVLTSGLAPMADRRRTARQVWDLVAGLGPLQRYLDDPTIEEVWVNERLTLG
jgi:pilus assembly protein CpaF